MWHNSSGRIPVILTDESISRKLLWGRWGSYSGRNLWFVYASFGTWVRTISGWPANGCIMAFIECWSLLWGVCFKWVIDEATDFGALQSVSQMMDLIDVEFTRAWDLGYLDARLCPY